MFLLLSRYVKPLREVDRWVNEHRAFLDRQYAAGRFIVSGPMQPREGGVIVTVEIERDELEDVMKDDPFVRERISEYTYVEFTATKRAEGFLEALSANRRTPGSEK